MFMSIHAIDKKLLLKIINEIMEVMKANEKYLTKLDADIGDADHGVNMARGFQKVIEMLSKEDPAKLDIGRIFHITGMALLQVVGGAAGPLYGMMFLEASKHFMGKNEMTVEDFVKFLEVAANSVKIVGGGTRVGDKTMLDVLQPVAEEARKFIANNKNADFLELLRYIVPIAKDCVKKTIPLIAKRGRASYLGERSINHQDPGATSTYLIIRTFLDVLENRRGVKVTEYNESTGELLKEEPLQA